MQLSPRYEAPPVLRLDVPVGDPAMTLLRQRRRLGQTLGGLSDDQWSAPSRCEGWSVQDVIAHLIGTNQYWAISIASGLNGEPTRYLATFDPVATPAQMVEPYRVRPASEVLREYNESVEGLAEVVTGLDPESWQVVAEAPPGHLSLHAVASHALWDAWIHERDVVLPLGIEPVDEPDEIVACLHYAAAIGPALAACGGETREGTLTIVATDPEVAFVVRSGATVVVEAGADDGPRLTGAAVALVESLSFRVPMDYGLAADDRWLLGGLGAVFDRTSA